MVVTAGLHSQGTAAPPEARGSPPLVGDRGRGRSQELPPSSQPLGMTRTPTFLSNQNPEDLLSPLGHVYKIGSSLLGRTDLFS